MLPNLAPDPGLIFVGYLAWTEGYTVARAGGEGCCIALLPGVCVRVCVRWFCGVWGIYSGGRMFRQYWEWEWDVWILGFMVGVVSSPVYYAMILRTTI